MVSARRLMPLETWPGAEDTGCPPPELFHSLAMGDLAGADRARLEEHAERCPACAAERELARAFAAPPELDEDGREIVARLERRHRPADLRETPRSPFSWPSWTWGLAAAASMAIAVSAIVSSPGPPPLPSAPGDQVTRGSAVELTFPLGEIVEPLEELRWREVAGAHRYQVTLQGVDGEVRWETRADGPRVNLPKQVAARLHSAVVYLWRVEALDAQGERLAISERAKFWKPAIAPPRN